MVQCNRCNMSGWDYMFETDIYALPLLSLEPCSHMFCIACIIGMRESGASPASSVTCVVCDSNCGVFQNYIHNGQLIRFPVNLDSISFYGKFSKSANDENEDEDDDDDDEEYNLARL
nr:pe38 [Spodoptera exigua multiple nucleopolyhedrovirus]